MSRTGGASRNSSPARSSAGGSGADEAEQIATHLEAIRRVMRQSALAEARSHPLGLTPPQVLALQVLVDYEREAGAGISLSELSKRMGLAHSTVSGIVTRLEQRGLMRRTTHPDDRRFLRIELAEPVREWLEQDLTASRVKPLSLALDLASSEERAVVLDGLSTLERLLAAITEP